ncbi:2-amino-4-hydroxy-6-hydroxymethyldihydropteridine diphosphokinase [Lutibacter sp. B2]|nr:2-amino-4-hydroxy-6-hydroxymethyldihydropteridine diphosphokinase [Lutibacter sp. B2]
MSRVFLGIGGNIGDKHANIKETLSLLQENPKIEIVNTSSYYETAPVGYEDQDWFLNIVVEIETSLEPYSLLEYCNHIEQELKRERLIHWGPRTIDVDILLYENFSSDNEKLIVPHPRMCERGFVIIPLYEIAPDLIIYDKPIKEFVDQLQTEEVRKINYEG